MAGQPPPAHYLDGIIPYYLCHTTLGSILSVILLVEIGVDYGAATREVLDAGIQAYWSMELSSLDAARTSREKLAPFLEGKP